MWEYLGFGLEFFDQKDEIGGLGVIGWVYVHM